MGAMDVGSKSLVSSSLLLLSTGIGSGVMVLPKAMAAVGYLPMLAVLAVGSLLSAGTTWVLFLAVAEARQGAQDWPLLREGGGAEKSNGNPTVLHAPSSKQRPSYADLLATVTPRWGPVALDVILIIYGEGALVTYFIFISNFVHKFDFWPSVLGEVETVALAACAVFPAVLLPTVGGLARFASAGIVALTLMTLGIWAREPAAASGRSGPLSAATRPERLPAVLCICVYAFMWHTNCVTVARELRSPTPRRCAAVACGATALLYVVYATIAAGGYLSWAEDVLGTNSIVDMYAPGDPLFIAIRLALSSALLVAIPINVYPIRESCVSLVGHLRPGYKLGFAGRALWGAGLVAFSAVVAMLYPDAVFYITVLGGTLVSLMMMVFPALIARTVLGCWAWRAFLAVCLAATAVLIPAGLGLIGEPV
mmetsp:Transcript_15802/g.49989  ORF Transcript_15802/g.49989 Transcript_15802/m.49989 type:complete len:424 (-) Transcript_15802:65-1336(-)